jgi:endonuclease YncB( thermonuclease family)
MARQDVPVKPESSPRPGSCDGDTIDVTTLPSDNIRFIGIDTAEVGTPCGAAAAEHLGALIAGRPATLVVAAGREDHDGWGGRCGTLRSPASTSAAK